MPDSKAEIHAPVAGGARKPVVFSKKKNISSRYLKWAPLVVVVLTAILYSQAFFNGFTSFDDDIYIIKNPFLPDFSWGGVGAIFSSFYALNYHPFTLLTYLFEFRFFGSAPLPYHILNVLLHLANTWLVFILAVRLSGKKITALVVSVLFAVHPMHVESVAWVSERKDVLYSFFYLLSLLCYLRYLESGFRGKYYIGTFVFFIASVFSKSAAITLPVLLVAIDVYKGRTINTKSVIEKIPILLISIFFGILNIMAQAKYIDAVDTSFGFINRIFLTTYAIASYIIRLFVPFSLSAMHYYPTTTDNLLNWEYYASLPFLLFLGWIVIRRSSFRKEMIFGVSFFLITICLTLQVISFGLAIIAERYTYIPYIGLFYIVGQWLSEVWAGRWRNIAVGAFTGVLTLFCIITWARIAVWKNDYTLYGDIINKNEGSKYCFYPFFVLGKEQYKEGNFKDAMQNFNESISLDPGYAETYNVRGALYFQLNDLKSALIDYNHAIVLNPAMYNVYNNRASVKASAGDFKGALIDYNSFLEKDPDNNRAYADRGMVRLNLRDSAGACQDFRKAVQYGYSEGAQLLNLYCH